MIRQVSRIFTLVLCTHLFIHSVGDNSIRMQMAASDGELCREIVEMLAGLLSTRRRGHSPDSPDCSGCKCRPTGARGTRISCHDKHDEKTGNNAPEMCPKMAATDIGRDKLTSLHSYYSTVNCQRSRTWPVVGWWVIRQVPSGFTHKQSGLAPTSVVVTCPTPPPTPQPPALPCDLAGAVILPTIKDPHEAITGAVK